MTASTEPLCAVLDFGGTKVAAALVRGRSILERQQVATDGAAPAEAQIASIATLLKPFLPKTPHLGVALTGRVHDGIWQPLNLETLAGFAQIDVQAELAARLGTPVVVLNDALAAAWGEYRLGAGQGATDMLYMTVSTGVGGGFILDGRLRQSPCGLAGHIGFAVIDPEGLRCGCGRRGTLEALASGSAIARQASALRGRDHTATEVFDAASRGEDWADQIIARSAKATAQSIANYKAAVGIERVVIGGGVGMAEGYVERVEHALQDEPPLFRTAIAKAALGTDSVLIGMADWTVTER